MSTAYMGLQLPTVSVTAGPAWATALNAAFSTVDAHDHTSGKGTPVPTAGLLINADLAFGGYNATGLRSARFAAQDATLDALSDLGCLYDVAGDLYWNNAAGTPVRLTDGTSIVGTAGSIAGMDGTTAAASYNSGTGTFTWQQASNTAAAMDVGPLVIRDTATGPLNAVTLASPANLESSYTLRLPTELFGGTRLLSVASGGVMSAIIALPTSTIGLDESFGLIVRPTSITAAEIAASAVTTAKIAANAVTRAKLASVGQQVSQSTGDFWRVYTTGAWENIKDPSNNAISVTVVSTGRPIVLMWVQDGSAVTEASIQVYLNSGTATPEAKFRLAVSGQAVGYVGTSVVAGEMFVPPGMLNHFYVPFSAGSYTFTAQLSVSAGTGVHVRNTRLVAYEL